MKRHKRERYVIRLPKDSVSPTGSIYGEYDIVEQGKVVCRYQDSKYVVRSIAPFTLVTKTKGKVKEFHSKLEK